ncbi:MAG TPA: tetratricopeptide repeat protein [Polyangiaceae bacterium]|nr:tetratricopeptide repeat protein [Polyangiaceae bacterium]
MEATASASALELYRAANDARRAGKTSEAIRGYKDLQRRFGTSAEARASRVSLGGLLLRSGSPSDALAQFDAYLEGGGQLAAEALFGRGRALQALGRSAEEIDNLERLVRQYPNSAYATHAKRRLDERR